MLKCAMLGAFTVYVFGVLGQIWYLIVSISDL